MDQLNNYHILPTIDWEIERDLSMPQYELMYLLGSNVADTDVAGITAQVQKFISDFGNP